jgi:D-tyrosyl-tRNA(Tyr) deacylase
MIALLQRVSTARVLVDAQPIAAIDQGLLVFVAVEPDDSEMQADRLLQRLLGYRVFADADGRMNLSVTDINGGLLLVPQFTLAADTTRGMRPGFSMAATPEMGERLFNYLVERAEQDYSAVDSGRFGADMQVMLTNDGPVTFWLRTG